ncbi:hypothetical protein JCM19055_576 [Geomicrobium sp. JCM 19055]|nr:hypothetical protein JCM19055_576 [Geomicrobium sp. JCM 19055]
MFHCVVYSYFDFDLYFSFKNSPIAKPTMIANPESKMADDGLPVTDGESNSFAK